MKQRASMVYPDHDAGGFAAIDAVLSHRRKPEAIRAHTSQWGKHLDVEDFLRGRARGSGGSWRRNGPLKTETRVRIPLGPPNCFVEVRRECFLSPAASSRCRRGFIISAGPAKKQSFRGTASAL